MSGHLQIMLPSEIMHPPKKKTFPTRVATNHSTMTDPGKQLIKDLTYRLDCCWTHAATSSHRLLKCDEATLRTVAEILPAHRRPYGLPAHCLTVDVRQVHDETKARLERLQAALEKPGLSFAVKRLQLAAERMLSSLEEITLCAGDFVLEIEDLNYEFCADGLLRSYTDPIQVESMARERSSRAREMLQVNANDHTVSTSRYVAAEDATEIKPAISPNTWNSILSARDEATVSPLWQSPTFPLEPFPEYPEPIINDFQELCSIGSSKEISKGVNKEWKSSFPSDFSDHESSCRLSTEAWAASFPTEFDSTSTAARETWAATFPQGFTDAGAASPAPEAWEATFPMNFASSGSTSVTSTHHKVQSLSSLYSSDVSSVRAPRLSGSASPWLDHGSCQSPQAIENNVLSGVAMPTDEASVGALMTREQTTGLDWASVPGRQCAIFDKFGQCRRCTTQWRRQCTASPQNQTIVDQHKKLSAQEAKRSKSSSTSAKTDMDAPQSYFARTLTRWVRDHESNLAHSSVTKSEDLLINDAGISSRICFERLPVVAKNGLVLSQTLLIVLKVQGYGYSELEIEQYVQADDENVVGPLEDLYRNLLLDESDADSEADQGLFTLDRFDIHDDDAERDGCDSEGISEERLMQSSDFLARQRCWDISIAGPWIYEALGLMR